MLVIGKVVMFHLREGLYDPATGRVDQAKLGHVARMAGHRYARTRDQFELRRPEANYVG